MVRILPCYSHKSYREVCFQQLYSRSKTYHGVCIWVISSVMHKLSYYFHRSYRTHALKQLSSGPNLPWCLYVSYRVYDSYITILFSRELSRYISQQFSPLWTKLPWCLHPNYQVGVSYFTKLLTQKLLGVHLSITFFPWSILQRCFYVNYHVHGSYIIMLFSRKVIGFIF